MNKAIDKSAAIAIGAGSISLGLFFLKFGLTTLRRAI